MEKWVGRPSGGASRLHAGPRSWPMPSSSPMEARGGMTFGT
jgi:hypothetical protein